MYAWFDDPRDLLPHLDDPEGRSFFERRIEGPERLRAAGSV